MIEGFNQPTIENLSLLFKNCFSIPVFQRPYSWGKDEISELFADIDEYFKNNCVDDLFMGTIYIAVDRQIKSSIFKYSIIDGQQRVTTLALICLLLYHYSIKYGFELDDTIVNLKSYLWKKTDGRQNNKNEPLLNSSSIEKRAMKYIFDTVIDYAGTDKMFNKIFEFKCENNQEEKIISNIRIINTKINTYIINEMGGNTELLLDYIDYIINNLKFITITVGRGNEKKLFEIFESINSK